MDLEDLLAEQFEDNRSHLRAVAYRMLGSLSDADDAVQESWIRLSRTDASGVDNLRGWLTTVISRICLDMLRTRQSRREDSLDARLPDPVVTAAATDPERAAVIADAVGIALLVVLDTLNPAERVAFVLHDLFAVPFELIAPIVDRSTDATKMLTSRARRRVQGVATAPDVDLARQREVVAAFHAASRGGGLAALVAVLDPDVVLRVDRAEGLTVIRGAAAVASQAVLFGTLGPIERPVVVNGAAGIVSIVDGAVFSLVAFTIVGGKIAALDIIADQARLAALGVTAE
ncbi:sigma-70 family RNA polymerase sigma factor [Antrihabitans sp. YC2-6]|uniref:sigma-70 family RNA polymerase sigma factor n=1 Tax=Antrihabitans sp. YC2-6 TaxID=2799498 RepID=UPI0018F2EE36|nr:sigma-70 family RNA polymerase sigma factor [Antrihabitans sp. YC2-6]MBJ8345573.1 sigma-70 family RNA polymerase sigma factor [Antrihabitans sp. YC2-6]